MGSTVEDLAVRVLAGEHDDTVKVARKLTAVRTYAEERVEPVIDVLNAIRAGQLECFLRLDGTYVVRRKVVRDRNYGRGRKGRRR